MYGGGVMPALQGRRAGSGVGKYNAERQQKVQLYYSLPIYVYYLLCIDHLTLTHAALFGVLLHVASLQSLALEKV